MDSSLELVACGLWPCVSTPDLSKVKEKQLHTRSIEAWKSLLHTAVFVEPVLVGLSEELYYILYLKLSEMMLFKINKDNARSILNGITIVGNTFIPKIRTIKYCFIARYLVFSVKRSHFLHIQDREHHGRQTKYVFS